MCSSQGRLFEEPPSWEQVDQSEIPIAEVVFVEGPRDAYSYRVPPHLVDSVAPGKRVSVPLGERKTLLTGYCLSVKHRRWNGKPLKEVRSVLDARTLLSPDLIQLALWMSDFYLCGLGQAMEAVVPSGVRGKAGTKEQTYLSAAPDAAPALHEKSLRGKQREVLQRLIDLRVPQSPKDLAEAVGCTQAPILALRKKGLILATQERVRIHHSDSPVLPQSEPHTMNLDQSKAVEAIVSAMHENRQETILLHGVTGSGKTEVYIRAIEEVVSFGRQAIVLVPEISLTPQTQERFRSRFRRVAVLHSHLSPGERHWQWERIERDQVDVVVGARSAVFAPAPRLGLIVIDEEHEASFKQDSTPRYHARETALERTRLCGVPLVLGSATPSLESWQEAVSGKFRLVTLANRVNLRSLPAVRIIDLCAEKDHHISGAISRPLHQAMLAALRADEQVILLLNRRGSATHVQCYECGEALVCPNCSITLTHHKKERKVLCHYCEYEAAPPSSCPHCRRSGLHYGGIGTQRLEEEVKARFPEYPCLRMDADTMAKPGSHERALDAFRRGDARILLGTQMIAKGLDFPKVTVVGVVNADTGIHLADFRAAERTFQLITQVAGRGGRGEIAGRVLVQTRLPDHYAVQAAARHDFMSFCRQELPVREKYGFPPYRHLVRMIVRSLNGQAARAFAQECVRRISGLEEHPLIRLMGPSPAPVSQLRGKYRFHLLALSKDRTVLHSAFRKLYQDLAVPKDVEWVLDVDPLDMI